jgi:beta-lactamase class A
MRFVGILPRMMRRGSYRSRWRLLTVSLLVMILAGPVSAAGNRTPGAAAPSTRRTCEPADLQSSDPALEGLIANVLGTQVDHYGVVVQHLDHATGAAVNPDRAFEAASLFKLGVMHEVFRQREHGLLDFGAALPITAAAAAWDLGTLRSWGAPGQRVAVEHLLEMMITISDNAAAVTLANRVGWRQIDAGLADLGLCATRTREPLRTTARDMAALLAAIARGEAVSPEASREMAALLLRQRIRDRIPAGVPREIPVGNKTANLPDATHDVAIVYAPAGPYVLAVLSDRPWTSAPIVELSRCIYAYYNDATPEAWGATCDLPC